LVPFYLIRKKDGGWRVMAGGEDEIPASSLDRPEQRKDVEKLKAWFTKNQAKFVETRSKRYRDLLTKLPAKPAEPAEGAQKADRESLVESFQVIAASGRAKQYESVLENSAVYDGPDKMDLDEHLDIAGLWILGLASRDFVSPEPQAPEAKAEQAKRITADQNMLIKERCHIAGRWGAVAVPVSPRVGISGAPDWILMPFVQVAGEWKLLIGCSENGFAQYELGDLWQTLSNHLDPEDAESLRDLREWFKDFESAQNAKKKD
jgi:hypothetical protein